MVEEDPSKNIMSVSEKKIIQEYKSKQLDKANEDKPMTQYITGYLVYLISSQTSLLKTSSSKLRIIYIGPLVVYKTIHKFQYILNG